MQTAVTRQLFMSSMTNDSSFSMAYSHLPTDRTVDPTCPDIVTPGSAACVYRRAHPSATEDPVLLVGQTLALPT